MRLVKEVDVSGRECLIKQEVYQMDNGEYVMVSTTDLGKAFGESIWNEMAGTMGAFAHKLQGNEDDLPTSGEETMVFPAEDDGNFSTDSDTVVLRENGDGSRERAMQRLKEMDDARTG